MMLEIWLRVILLSCGVFFTAKGAFVGVNIGTDVSNVPSAADIVAILRTLKINHVRLFDADAHLLNALSNTGIEVMVSVTNEEVLGIGELPSTAAAWINKNIVAYVPSTNITAICVGSEVLTSLPHAAPILVPAMSNLYKALVASNLNDRVKVSTPNSMDLISRSFPPSTATFNTTSNSTIYQILQFLKSTKSFYMLNAYPYYEYVNSNGIFPLEYALFEPLSPVKQIVDPNTLFHYNSMFDALVDATYNAIAALNFSGIPITVTETGWPSFGGTKEPDATSQNAERYNKNLIRRVSNDSGPPSQPSIPINTYIYELFNEDKKSGPISERNYGVLFTNGSDVYDLGLSDSDVSGSNSSGVFCVARPGADESSLRSGLDWACGPGQADCDVIQQGKSCFVPDTLQNHASYAYNDYYQKKRTSGGSCDFSGSAVMTSVDPSYGSCRFTGSTNSGTGAPFPSPALGPAGPSSTSSRTGVLHFGALVAVVTATLTLLDLINLRYIL